MFLLFFLYVMYCLTLFPFPPLPAYNKENIYFAQVGRAFSFNKTPSKLKRAVSTMMTPPFGSTNSLTPASQLAQMRLASCANIHVSSAHNQLLCK